MSLLQQPYCTLGNLERLGIATKALQALPLLSRRDAIKGASGLLEPALRTRHKPPFLVEHDPDFDDTSGMLGGAVPAWSLAPAGPVGTVRPMDVALAFPAGGIVGASGITYTLNTDAGAYGSTPSGSLAFPLSGLLPIGGYPFRLAIGATVTAGDALFFCLRTNAGLTSSAAFLAAWILLHARGVDPKTEADLLEGKKTAEAWVKAIATGDGDLDRGADATPNKQEGGVRFKTGRAVRDAYGWVNDQRRRWS